MINRNKWISWIQSLRTGEKLTPKNYLLIILLVGILLLVIVWPMPSDDSENTMSEKESDSQKNKENFDYEEYLEDKTERLLCEVEGAGKVTVMLTVKSGGQKIIEKDQTSGQEINEEEDSEGGTRSVRNDTSEFTSVYEQNADGSSIPYVSEELLPQIEGVVVIADGGGDAVVAKNLAEAIQALFGVDAHKIKIMKRA